MIEVYGDLWEYVADATCITTNGFVKNNGEAVMGRGCAKEASELFPNLPVVLGDYIKAWGNNVFALEMQTPAGMDFPLYTFPVKHHWKDKADIDLITKSAMQLSQMATDYGDNTVVIPRPGCGNGQLHWTDVKPVLESILDDRFHIITWSEDD